jgi:hypothetical protein
MKTERELFNYLKQIIPDLRKSEDQFSSWDCSSQLLKARIELKCRRKHYDELLIEEMKFDKLIGYNNPLYINSTPKGVYLWKLKEQSIEWSERPLPKTTDFKTNENVNKRVGYLSVKNAFIIDLFS